MSTTNPYRLSTNAMYDTRSGTFFSLWDAWFVHVATGDVNNLEAHLQRVEGEDLTQAEDGTLTFHNDRSNGPHFTPVRNTFVTDPDDEHRLALTDEYGVMQFEVKAHQGWVTHRYLGELSHLRFDSPGGDRMLGDADFGAGDDTPKTAKVKQFMLRLVELYAIWED
jgi:hypothetical protein